MEHYFAGRCIRNLYCQCHMIKLQPTKMVNCCVELLPIKFAFINVLISDIVYQNVPLNQ